MTRFVRLTLAGTVAVLLAPAAALAAPPVVTTGAAKNVTQTTASLRGKVNPKGNQTVYFFQYGTSKLYDAQTPETAAGGGDTAVPAAADIAGLAPFTTYHYRLVASYGQRIVFGKDARFKTARQPLGLTLGASPATVFENGSTTIGGNLSGTNNADRDVVLQANPHPFAGFADVNYTVKTDSAGNFAFPLYQVPVNTVFRVRLPSNEKLVSPEIAVNVRVVLETKVDRRKVRRGKKVHFRGRVTPANPGAPILLQRKFYGQFVTVKRTRLGKSSRYSVGIKPPRSGSYRVVVTPGTAYVGDVSSTKTIKVKRKRRGR